MIKKRTLTLVLVLLFIVSAALYYKFDITKTQRILEELNTEYPAISTEDEIKGVITEVIQNPFPKVFRNNPNHAFVIINESLKKRIKAHYQKADSNDERNIVLDDIISEGDMLMKEKGSYVFHIYKAQGSDTLKFTFELSDDLGYSLKDKNNEK